MATSPTASGLVKPAPIRLDRTKATSEVIGQPGVKWAQSGALFNFQGQRVDENGRVLDPSDKGFRGVPVTKTTQDGTPDYFSLSDDELKLQAEVFSIPWTSRAEVLSALG